MACHVSTCMGFDLFIKWEFTTSSQKERKGRERKERAGKEKRKGGKGKEKRKREKKEMKGKGKEKEKEEGGRWFISQFTGVPTVGTCWTKK